MPTPTLPPGSPRPADFPRRVVLPLLLAVAAGLLVGVVLNRILEDAIAGRTEETAFSLLERVRPEVEAILSAGADPRETVNRIGRQLALRATLVATDGRVLGDSAVDPARLAALESHAGRPEVRDALRTGRGVQTRFSSTLGQRLVYAAVRLRGGEVLRLAFPEKDLAAWEAPYRRRSLFVCAVAGLLAGAFSVRVRRRHASELLLVRKAVEAVGRGERPANPGTVSDEAASVHAALGDLADLASGQGAEASRREAVSRAVFEGVPAGLLVVDRDLSVLDANPAALRLLRVDPNAPRKGEHVLELVREKVVADLLRQALEDGRATRPLRVPLGEGEPAIEADAIRVSVDAAAGRPAAVAILRETASRPSA